MNGFSQPALSKVLSLSSARDSLLFGVLAGMVLVTAQAIHAVTHELMGHGLASFLLGVNVPGVYISPFGISETAIGTANDPSTRILIDLAGPLVGMSICAVLSFAYNRLSRGKSFRVRLFLLMLAIAFGTDFLYAFVSPLTGFGDTADAAALSGVNPLLISGLVAPLAAASYYFLLRRFMELLAPYRAAGSFRARLGLVLKVSYLPVLFYIFLSALLSLTSPGPFLEFSLVIELVTAGSVLPVAVLAAIRRVSPDVGVLEGTLSGLVSFAAVGVMVMVGFAVFFGPTLATSVCCGSFG